MFVEVVTSALLDRAWRERNVIAQFVKDLVAASANGKFRLFAFGPGGVGKTTLGKLLSGEFSLETVPPDYNLSLEMEKHGVEGRHFICFYVPPGQEDKRAYHWDDLYRQMKDAERYAIINVVCWGYHSLGKIEFTRHKLYEKDMSEEDFLTVFLNDRRAAELNIVRELLPQLKTAPGKLRMLTLVSKQDLWWTTRDQVQEFYEQGDYSGLIDELRKHKGEANFSHDYISASLNLLNFRTEDGRVLTKTVAGYDNTLRVANFHNAMQHIRGLIA